MKNAKLQNLRPQPTEQQLPPINKTKPGSAENIMKLLNKVKEEISDIFWPKRCMGCKKEGRYVCDKCEIFLSEAPNNIKGLMAVWEYEGLMEKLIWRIKHDGMYDIVNELVEKAFEKITLELPEDTYITYVPMYKKKEKQRGFNQAELIAKKVGQIAGKEVVPLLIKTKDNCQQASLRPEKRLENVKDAFQWKEGAKRPSNVMLVDDFLVSGATMKECFQVLRKAGVKNVWGFALAKVV